MDRRNQSRKVQRKTNMIPVISRTGLFLTLTMGLGLAAWESSSAQTAVNDGPSRAAPVLKPQMIVTPADSGVWGACRSRALLQELHAHLLAGEKSQAQAMVQNQDCMTLPQDGRFRVLSVRDGMVEFVLFSSRSATGYWALMETIKPVK
jgi:hypothetical protein